MLSPAGPVATRREKWAAFIDIWPVITITGLQLGSIIAFAIITETVFQWPGMGLMFLRALQSADIPVQLVTLPGRHAPARARAVADHLTQTMRARLSALNNVIPRE